jgi:hypothetical protein
MLLHRFVTSATRHCAKGVPRARDEFCIYRAGSLLESADFAWTKHQLGCYGNMMTMSLQQLVSSVSLRVYQGSNHGR